MVNFCAIYRLVEVGRFAVAATSVFTVKKYQYDIPIISLRFPTLVK